MGCDNYLKICRKLNYKNNPNPMANHNPTFHSAFNNFMQKSALIYY